MSVNLSIKNVPDELAERLRARAAHNHRSLQGELMSILERELQPPDTLDLLQLYRRGRAAGLRTPSESVQMIREDRDSDHGRDPLP
jgi:plasmid stability protein